LAAQGPDNKEFVEPKVQGLWKIATASNFTTHELESLRVSQVEVLQEGSLLKGYLSGGAFALREPSLEAAPLTGRGRIPQG
jgi:Alpha-2-macroglobulin RAP, C-terminal domain